MTKRLFDLIAATAGLVVLAPLVLLAAVAVRLDSPGPAFFVQERVGRGFRRFGLLKFRTMVRDAAARGPDLTIGADARVTRVGRVLRKAKFDEVPQLLNVIRGEMSLVGPRPELPRFVEMFRSDYERILSVRPGMTDLASIRFRDEADCLAGAADPEDYYVTTILPQKLALARDYIERASVPFDVGVIARTILTIAVSRSPKVR